MIRLAAIAGLSLLCASLALAQGYPNKPIRLMIGYTAGGWRTDKHVRLLGDITGDGNADLAAFGDSGVFVQRSGTPVNF